jgi:rhodanese-related sulfurtransferase
MQSADAPDHGYDGDALSQRLDAAFSALFGQPATALWVATGTAANCLTLAAMVPPHGGIVCHREAHIETDEGGAPGFYTHGAKLILAEGDAAKLTPETIHAAVAPIRNDVHRVQPHAISITNATEYGRVYTPDEVAAGLRAGRMLLVDVRELNETAVEAYPDAVIVPLSAFDPAAIPDPQGKQVVFACRSGRRSITASVAAQDAGYPYSAHMAGGIIAWKAAGLPTKS